LRVLDLATGAGDVPLRLYQLARREGLPIEVAGCDRSLTALDFATERAAAVGASVDFFVHDAVNGPPLHDFDALTCSLFLHHLDEDSALQLLLRMKQEANHLVLVNDLERGAAGWLLAQIVTRVITRSAIVHADGPQSVAAAFTRSEVLRLADRAGMTGVTVVPRWPFRWLLTYQKSLVSSPLPLVSSP
jgi:SAM-dependent methyltransferase